MIDQMFDDPNVQSQFQCLDNDEQPIVSLMNFHNHSKNDTPVIAEYVNTDIDSSIKWPQHKPSDHAPTTHQLSSIKQSLKGVLHKYELSFTKPTLNNLELPQT